MSVECAAPGGRHPALWSAELRDNSNVVRWELTVQRPADWQDVRSVNLLKIHGGSTDDQKPHVVGDVDGSPIVMGNLFLAAEDPLADNHVMHDDVYCEVPFLRPPSDQAAWRCSAVVGVAPPGQMRRAFLYYLKHSGRSFTSPSCTITRGTISPGMTARWTSPNACGPSRRSAAS